MTIFRLVLCLALLAAGSVFAQSPEEWTPYTPSETQAPSPPPLVPGDPPPPPPPDAPSEPRAPSSTKPSAPKSELFPREFGSQSSESDRGVGRFFIAPFAGAFSGAVGGMGGAIVSMFFVLPFCLDLDELDEKPGCVVGFVSFVSLGVTAMEALGVYAVNQSMGGRGRFLGTLTGALVGASLGAVSGTLSSNLLVLFLGLGIGPIIGSMVGYEISDALASSPGGPAPLARKELPVMPMLGTTPRGGLFGGLSGRF